LQRRGEVGSGKFWGSARDIEKSKMVEELERRDNRSQLEKHVGLTELRWGERDLSG